MHPESSATVDELIAAARDSHAERAATDPVYAQHADALARRTGLARVDAGADELAGVDYSDPSAVAVTPPPVRDTSVIDHNLLRRLDLLKQERTRTKKADADVAEQIRALEEEAITQMVESGQVVGYPFGDRKATVGSKVWGKWLDDVTPAERHAAFREAGGDWAALVQQTINSNTLQAMLTEWESDHGELPDSLPEPLRRVMTTTEKYNVTFSNVARTRTVARSRKTAGQSTRSAD